ncbi:MAG: hypothetical protein ACYS21_10465, partial [Planctomycetota bacterium]
AASWVWEVAIPPAPVHYGGAFIEPAKAAAKEKKSKRAEVGPYLISPLPSASSYLSARLCAAQMNLLGDRSYEGVKGLAGWAFRTSSASFAAPPARLFIIPNSGPKYNARKCKIDRLDGAYWPKNGGWSP